MIQYANAQIAPQIRQMWKTVFGDSDAYMDIYFREKYRNEHTLVYMENEKAMASLQMLPYRFTFCDVEIPVAYISGAATLPEARKKGYMEQLLLKSFDEMAKNGISLSILVPQEEWLLRFYEKYGYVQTFDAGTEYLDFAQQPFDLPLPSRLRLHKSKQPYFKWLLNESIEQAYKEFDAQFRTKDMTVQKTFDDFRTIVEEAQLFNFPPKKNLIGMVRIIDAEKLLTLFAKRYHRNEFSVRVFDEMVEKNNATFVIDNDEVEKNAPIIDPVFQLDIRKLTQLLFGYHTSKEEVPFPSLFPEKTPVMNFMLE